MRVLCRDHGWTTDGKTVKLPAPGDRCPRLSSLVTNSHSFFSSEIESIVGNINDCKL